MPAKSEDHDLKAGGITRPEDSVAVPVIKGSSYYEPLYPLRAIIQAIPYVGGTIDMILAGPAVRWQAKRMEAFILELSERLKKLEGEGAAIPLDSSEALHDLVRMALEHAIRTRSDQRRHDLASIVSNQASAPKDWNDAEAAMSLLSDLSDTDVAILRTVAGAEPCNEPLKGFRVGLLGDWPSPSTSDPPPLDLRAIFSNLPGYALRLSASRLVSRGLLHDEGIGRWGGRPMTLLVATDLGDWFCAWISGPGSA